jgi:cell division protein FtsQ
LFFKTLTQVASRYGRTATSLLFADLRYEGGYALRLRGVSTVVDDDFKQAAIRGVAIGRRRRLDPNRGWPAR